MTKNQRKVLKDLSVNIRHHRRFRDITQEALADKLGVGADAVCRWEKGDRIPTLPHIIRLAEIFKLTPQDLLGTI